MRIGEVLQPLMHPETVVSLQGRRQLLDPRSYRLDDHYAILSRVVSFQCPQSIQHDAALDTRTLTSDCGVETLFLLTKLPASWSRGVWTRMSWCRPRRMWHVLPCKGAQTFISTISFLSSCVTRNKRIGQLYLPSIRCQCVRVVYL